MYSYEDRMRAVRLYLKLGKRVGATIRQLGYPSRRSLTAWIGELHPEIGKRNVGRATGSIPKSPAVKQAAVIELCTREESARLLAQKAGVSRPTLYNWKNQLLGREAPASMKRQKKPAPDSERAELEQQVESLRRDVRQLQLEHDILTKANELIKKGWASPRNS